jgi:hypothetical protein
VIRTIAFPFARPSFARALQRGDEAVVGGDRSLGAHALRVRPEASAVSMHRSAIGLDEVQSDAQPKGAQLHRQDCGSPAAVPAGLSEVVRTRRPTAGDRDASSQPESASELSF